MLELDGNPSISGGMEDELAAIKGETRIIPVYDQVTGQGTNALYRIVQFVGVRIVDVDLRGNKADKLVVVQPARVIVRGGIPSSDPAPRSHFIYSPVLLVR